MTLQEVMTQLEALGNPATQKIFANHGATGPSFGVKVADLKTLMKKIKKNQPLALELFATGNLDAMYLAGLIGDPKQVTADDLNTWTEQASWYMVGEYMVAGLAAESPHGWELGLRWIEDERDHVSAIGWNTLAGVISITDNDKLDLAVIEGFLERIKTHIHESKNRTRYCMNGFVIGVGAYVPALLEKAMNTTKAIGKVDVDQGDTKCKVPFGPDYLQKIIDMDRVGKKRKKVRC